MNQQTMASSLSNSLYNAIIPFTESDVQYSEYSEYYSRMEQYPSPTLQESDFLNTENGPVLDGDLLQAFAGTDFTPLVNLTIDMPLTPESDFFPQDQEGSEGTEDCISDYSEPDPDSYGEYPTQSISIMRDEPDYTDYNTDPDLLNCQPMTDLIFTPHSQSDSQSQKKKPGRKKGQTSKVLHLWEFIRDLLKDPKFSGNIIQWENRQDGVFRVVKSSEVASLWGQKKKNKKTMTYEKMSRSMRYSRKEGYFIDLPKNSGYPKKLCFRFGPKSTGWQ